MTKHKMGKWTEEENNYLRKYYPFHTASEISMILNRSKRAIYIQAQNLGISKKRSQQQC